MDLEGWGGALVGVGFTGMLYCFPKRIEVPGIRLRESWSGFGVVWSFKIQLDVD